MTLVDWITGTAGTVAKVATVAVANPPTPKIVFSETDYSGIDFGQFATATPAPLATHDPAPLPADLIEAATRYCKEIHRDGPEAAAAMLADLRDYPPASWPLLVDYFTRQLPALPADPVRSAIVATCGTCRHGVTTDRMAAVVQCAAGVPSGLPVAGRWHDDRQHCHKFTDRHTGSTPALITETQDTTQTATRDPFNPFEC